MPWCAKQQGFKPSTPIRCGLSFHGILPLTYSDVAQVEEKAVAAQQVAAARVADLAKAAAAGVPVLADPGQPLPPSPARAALADVAGRLEKLHRGATMHLRLNRIAHGARLLGLRPVSLPHGMLKVRQHALCCYPRFCLQISAQSFMHQPDSSPPLCFRGQWH